MTLPQGPFRGQHVLSAAQFDRAGLERLLGLAERFAAAVRDNAAYECCRGLRLRSLFFEESTRTIGTFEEAFLRLGGNVLHLHAPKEDSPEDMARVTTASVHCAVVRHPDAGFVGRYAAAAQVPVINAGNGEREHPTQALLDLYTVVAELRRQGRAVSSAKIVVFGDLKSSRSAHSLIVVLSAYAKFRFVLASPGDLRMPPEFVRLALANGGSVEETRDFAGALAGADVIYATRFKHEGELGSETRRQAESFRLDRALLARCGASRAIVMHPMPRGERFGELSTDLDDLPDFAMFRQASNGLPVRMALLCSLLGTDRSLGW